MKFSERYSKRWEQQAKKARQATNYYCCLCLKKTYFLHVHHAVYTNKKNKKIAGHELIGVHLFPLCKSCHAIAHLPENWIKDKKNPVLKNRNTPKFYQQLINNFKLFSH